MAHDFRAMIQDLQDLGITLAMIAEHIGVSERQVSNWKTGDRPLGESAINLYLFHMEHRNAVHRIAVHSENKN